MSCPKSYTVIESKPVQVALSPKVELEDRGVSELREISSATMALLAKQIRELQGAYDGDFSFPDEESLAAYERDGLMLRDVYGKLMTR